MMVCHLQHSLTAEQQQGYVFPTQSRSGLIGLDLWWSDARKDMYLVGSDQSIVDAKQSGYKLIGR